MQHKVIEIEGIGKNYAEKLNDASVFTINDLLEKACTKKGRALLSESTGLPESLILTWVNHADLMRINGVGTKLAELLEAAGVDTVKEFSKRNSNHLHQKMIETNDRLGLVERVPSVETLQQMIDFAQSLEPKLTY